MLLCRRLRPAPVAVAGRLFSDSAVPEYLDAVVLRRGRGGDTLGRRLLSLVYPKRSAVVVLRKWTEEGMTVQKYQLNRVVRELRKYKRYKHALEICEWMTIQNDIRLLPGDYAVHLDLVAKIRGLPSAEKFFEDLPEKLKGQSTCTALLHAYVQNKMPVKAESLYEEMLTHSLLRCALPFNHMINLYISNGEMEKIPKIIMDLKRTTVPDELTYNLLLNACAISGDVSTAEKVFLEMKNGKRMPDWITYSTLTSIYIKARFLEKAKETLEEMERRVSRKERSGYSSLISLYSNLSDGDNVLRIWMKMKSMFPKMSDMEYKCVLSSLVKLGDVGNAENIYDEWENVSGTGNSRVPNMLLGFYAKGAMMDKAERFYERMIRSRIKPSYSTWEILGLGYLSKQNIVQMLDCFEKALASVEKWEPNVELVRVVFKELQNFGDFEGAERFISMLRNAGYVTTEIYNLLVQTYAKAGKMPLIISERMMRDNVEMDEETRRLIKLASRFPMGTVASLIS